MVRIPVATNLEYQTRTEREAYAVYTQGRYEFNENWALTLGLRWAEDNLNGYETVFYYSEGDIVPLGFDAAAGGASTLAATNQALGFLGANGEILDPNRLLTTGLPTSQSLWRQLDRTDDEITWRVNLDWIADRGRSHLHLSNQRLSIRRIQSGVLQLDRQVRS